jgi:hypothetical protein
MAQISVTSEWESAPLRPLLQRYAYCLNNANLGALPYNLYLPAEPRLLFALLCNRLPPRLYGLSFAHTS